RELSRRTEKTDSRARYRGCCDEVFRLSKPEFASTRYPPAWRPVVASTRDAPNNNCGSALTPNHPARPIHILANNSCRSGISKNQRESLAHANLRHVAEPGTAAAACEICRDGCSPDGAQRNPGSASVGRAKSSARRNRVGAARKRFCPHGCALTARRPPYACYCTKSGFGIRRRPSLRCHGWSGVAASGAVSMKSDSL